MALTARCCWPTTAIVREAALLAEAVLPPVGRAGALPAFLPGPVGFVVLGTLFIRVGSRGHLWAHSASLKVVGK